MNKIVFVVVTAVCSFNHGITSGSCGDDFEGDADISKESFTDMINDYALRVVKSSFDKTRKNWFLFPINVVSILSTLYLGSNGTFADELRTVLRFTDETKIHRAFEDYWKRWDSLGKSYTFKTLDFILISNKLSLSETYKSNATKYYPKSILKNVSFPDSLNKINDEIWELTNRSIRSAVSEDDVTPDTLLFVISAAYLNARWDVGFNITETKAFYLQDRNNTSIPHESMFVSSFFDHKKDEETQCDVVQLDMNDGDLSMFLVVPIKGKTIKEFNNNVESDVLKSWINMASFQRIKINLRIPKASPRGVLPLKSMIIHSLFDKNLRDLSGMVNNHEKLFADQYLQVGFTEYGNFGEVGSGKFDPDALSIEAVVPFVYFIVDTRTKMVLLAGKYTNPIKIINEAKDLREAKKKEDIKEN